MWSFKKKESESIPEAVKPEHLSFEIIYTDGSKETIIGTDSYSGVYHYTVEDELSGIEGAVFLAQANLIKQVKISKIVDTKK